MIEKTHYICEICGASSINKAYIESCEKKGKETPLVKIGDKVIYTDDIKDYRFDGNFRDINLFYKKEALGYFKGKELEIIDIIIHPHFVTYLLGQNGCSIFSGFDTYGSWRYPEIHGNKDFNNHCKIIE